MAGFDWPFYLELSLTGLAFGGIYALAAVAFVVIYKATKVVNFAIGHFMMLGGFFFFAFTTQLHVPIVPAILLTLVGGALVGAISERLFIRPLLGKSHISVIMVTIGISSIVVGLVEMAWGTDAERLPEFLPNKPLVVAGMFLPSKSLIGFAVAAVVVTLFLLAFRFWRGGVALRAAAADSGGAYAMGINVPLTLNLSWVVSSTAAAGAGILVGAIGGINSVMHLFGLSVLVIAIFGGLDSILGALVGGLFVGLVESLVVGAVGGDAKLSVTFLILVVVLLVRPYGLFGTREVERL